MITKVAIKTLIFIMRGKFYVFLIIEVSAVQYRLIEPTFRLVIMVFILQLRELQFMTHPDSPQL